MKAPRLSEVTGKDVWLKYENLQLTGSFKIRGATHFMLAHQKEAQVRGVVAASAGNHAQGVACASKRLGISCRIYMPEGSSPLKVARTESFGACVVQKGAIFDESATLAKADSEESGRILVPAFFDKDVIAGQGTLALELLSEAPFASAQALLVAVGGGGLAAGIGTVLRAKRPDIKIYGCSAQNAPAQAQAFHTGVLDEKPVSFTLADGVAVKKGEPAMLPLLKQSLDDVVTLPEPAIAHAIAFLLEHEKVVVEGAGALPVAALLTGLVREQSVVLILSGGNIDLTALSSMVHYSLVEQERIVRFKVTVPDRPGGLEKITRILASQRANILQVFHQRATSRANIGETEIEFDIETASKAHSQAILNQLAADGFTVIKAV